MSSEYSTLIAVNILQVVSGSLSEIQNTRTTVM